MLALSPVPAISIFPAPPEEPLVEPFSPFAASAPTTPDDSDSFRPSLLSPPPTVSPRFPRQLSPLRPVDAPVTGKGLERNRFEELLRASKERNAALGGKKSPDLRKEIALKVHKNKQVERRALFLSKVQAPPSPSATLLPKTPPESPAIFHYSLPSPGMKSPLAVYEEMVTENPAMPSRRTWVEQVEFHVSEKENLRSSPCFPSSPRRKVPSLEQITAHLSSHGAVFTPHQEAVVQPVPSSRLPALQKLAERCSARERAAATSVHTAPLPDAKRSVPTSVGRLQFPSRSPTPPSQADLDSQIKPRTSHLPPSPRSPVPKLCVRTTVVPHTSSRSPVDLTESNLYTFNTMRVDKAQAMLCRLRLRTLPHSAANTVNLRPGDEEDKKLRRRSAPPELPLRERRGFSKPPLDLPGAF